MEKTCGFCGNKFEAQSAKAKYCCDAHRNAAWYKAGGKKGNLSGPDQSETHNPTIMSHTEIEKPPGLDFNTQYIFDLQKKEIQRWEDSANEFRKKFETVKDAKDLLEKEFEKYKNEKQIEAIKGEKPSGLQGLAESPFIQQLMPDIGPALGQLMSRAIAPGPGSPAGPGDPVAEAVIQQPEEVQNAFRELLNLLMTYQTPQNILSVIGKIKNLLKSGSTVHSNTFNPTGTFGM